MEFGYPTARELLPRVWGRLNEDKQAVLGKIVRFHHPGWDGRAATLPEVEELLTELAANKDLLPSLRSKGGFSVSDLESAREGLLLEIARWFHEIHAEGKGGPVLRQVVKRIKATKAAIISFNWDYELDKALLSTVTPASYGIGDGTVRGTVLLKPHGSLNWYPGATGAHIRRDLRKLLWSEKGKKVYCFLRWREIRSGRRQYLPWIVPPTHLKDFNHPMLKRIWQRCVDVLSKGEKVYFLGYSLPPADWHSRYIFRCGFHNQQEGLPVDHGREKPTGRSRVWVVNPDPGVFRRIESIVGWKCKWVPKRIGEWLRVGS